jgi:hypothetical protein
MGKRLRASIGWKNEDHARRAVVLQQESRCAILHSSRRHNSGAGIRAQNLQIMPLDFELSFDGFRTVRNCRLIWRQDKFFGVAFES